LYGNEMTGSWALGSLQDRSWSSERLRQEISSIFSSKLGDELKVKLISYGQ
jgi:hypothetical protein